MTDLAAALRHAHPELEVVRKQAEEPVYLVGGAVRDLLLGRPRADVDLVVVGDAASLAERLGGAAVEHERFGTVKVEVEGHEIDIATARSESYPAPGALPVIVPAEDIEADLSRRDFTINAMAIPIDGEARLVDPHGGEGDLKDGVLRVLHPRSFEDDPTRAIRAARYAARLGFRLDPATEELLRKADVATVSSDRRRAELERLAEEETACRGYELLAEWGLIELRDGGLELMRAVGDLFEREHWSQFAPREEVLISAEVVPAGGRGAAGFDVAAEPGRGGRAGRATRPGGAGPGAGDGGRLDRALPDRLEKRDARDRRQRPDRGRGARGTRGRSRTARGAPASARRRSVGPRPRVGSGTGGCAWSGVNGTASAGWKLS